MKCKTTHSVLVITVILLVVLVCGCGEKGEAAGNRTSATITLISEDDAEDSISDSGDVTSSGATVTPSESALGTTEVADSVPQNNYVITPITEGLCEQLEASELGELAAYNAFNRLERNDKTELMLEHKVCVDDITGVVYYVNVGRDYFLYRIKDGKSELAVELPVNYLYTHNGVVYFLLDAQNILNGDMKSNFGAYLYDKFTFEGMNEGDIYSYTPATGKVELVYPAQALRLKVTDAGIYYLKGQLDKNEKSKASGFEWYYLPFGGSEPEQIESGGMYDVWNDYQYDYSNQILKLKSEATGDVIDIVSEKGYIRSCIYKDMVFALNVKPAAIPICFDLLTKEEKFSCNLEESIAATDWAPKGEESFLLNRRKGHNDNLQQTIEKRLIQSGQVALTEDSMLWFVVQQYIYRINLETGETQLFYYPITEYGGDTYAGGVFSENSQLYTDGKNLYVIYYYPYDKKGEPVLVRLTFEYEEETDIWYWNVTDKIGEND